MSAGPGPSIARRCAAVTPPAEAGGSTGAARSTSRSSGSTTSRGSASRPASTACAAKPFRVCPPARSLFRPLRAMHCLLRNFTHATVHSPNVAGRWQAGIGNVLDEIQARAPPDAIFYASPAGTHYLTAIAPAAARARRQPCCRRSGGYGAPLFDSHRYRYRMVGIEHASSIAELFGSGSRGGARGDAGRADRGAKTPASSGASPPRSGRRAGRGGVAHGRSGGGDGGRGRMARVCLHAGADRAREPSPRARCVGYRFVRFFFPISFRLRFERPGRRRASRSPAVPVRRVRAKTINEKLTAQIAKAAFLAAFGTHVYHGSVIRL